MKNKNLKKLAFYGGKKTRLLAMPNRKAIGKNEKNKIFDVLNYYSKIDQDPPYDGIFQKEFENKFVKKMNGGFATAVSTGSIACYIGIKSLSLKKNSEVIVSPVTDSGSIFSIIENNLHPVIVDSSKYNYNTNWSEIKKGLNKKTSAIFLVHSVGNVAEIEEIKYHSNKHGLPVIEDCSQSPFAKNKNGDFVGTIGKVSVFSTMYRKSLQTGGSGGIVFTKSKSLNKTILEQSDRGRPKWSSKYNSRDPGAAKRSSLNYNTDEFSSAIGIASIERISKTINDRIRFLKHLKKNTSKLNEYMHQINVDENSSPFLYPIILNERYKKNKNKIAKMILSEGINLSPEYSNIVADWKITKKLDIKVIKNTNVKHMKSLSFNLFLNENYKEREAIDISMAFEKVYKSL